MPKLNTAFNKKSNATFNNKPFSESTISGMHETMRRLYSAAEKLKRITGQSALARAMNVSPQTVNNWEARGVSQKGMLDAQEKIGVSATWIASGLGTMIFDHDIATAALRDHIARQGVDDGGIPISEMTEYFVHPYQPLHVREPSVEFGPAIRGMVPLISWVQAGSWCGVVDNFAPGDAEDWMPCIKRVGPQAFALRVRGVSMEPKYQDGDIIFVDPDAAAEHGKNVVVRLDDAQEATFKNLVVEGSRRFLRPLNPDWPEKMIEVNGNATICGVVVGKWVPE